MHPVLFALRAPRCPVDSMVVGATHPPTSLASALPTGSDCSVQHPSPVHRLRGLLLWVVLSGLLLTGQSAVKAQTQCPGAWTFSGGPRRKAALSTTTRMAFVSLMSRERLTTPRAHGWTQGTELAVFETLASQATPVLTCTTRARRS